MRRLLLSLTLTFALATPPRAAAARAALAVTAEATSRQAVLRYTAPSTSACTVEVSESATYSPAVNDVNATLFAGADSDARPGSAGSGAASARAFVVGRMQQDNGTLDNLAADGRRYGRLLTPNTLHYYRVTCGSDVGTGTFTTKNRPVGMTHADAEPVASAGTYAFPSVDWTNRAEIIIDPSTGMKMCHVSTSGSAGSDDAGGSDYMAGNDTGSQVPWAQAATLDSSGNSGYLLMSGTANGASRLYWINTTTCQSRYHGTLRLPGGTLTNIGTTYVPAASSLFSADATKVYAIATGTDNEMHVIRCALPASGNSYWDTSDTPGSDTNCTWADRTPSATLTDQLTAFTASDPVVFDPVKFPGANKQWTQGGVLFFACLRGAQDSPGWVGAWDLTTETLIGAFPSWQRGSAAGGNSFRWCGFHTGHEAVGTEKMSWTAKELYQTPYQTTLTGAINSSATTITLGTNVPTNTGGVLDSTLLTLAAGDAVTVGTELMLLVTNTSGTTWTVTRGQYGTVAASHSSGDPVSASCEATWHTDVSAVSINWWDAAADPHGLDTTNTNLRQIAELVTGHEGWANGYKVSEGGWYACAASAGEPCGTPLFISDAPAFDGANKAFAGNAALIHPSPPQQSPTLTSLAQGRTWGTDFMGLDGDVESYPTTLTNVTGTLWKWASSFYTLSRKRLPMLAMAGSHWMLDVSSTATGNVIGGGAGDNYKYCVADNAGECRAGSSAGDIYINAPDATGSSFCNSGVFPPESALCFSHLPGQGGQAIIQMNLTEATTTGKWTRTVSSTLMPFKRMMGTASAHASPDGKLLVVPIDHDGKRDLMAVVLPPFPAYDSVGRNTFISKAVTVSAVGGADNAIVKFGYDSNLYCRSRNEKCVAATSNSPYFNESESYTGVSCAGGCSVSVPVLPDHVAYYQVIWRSGSSVVSTGAVQVMTEDSAAASGSGGGATTTGSRIAGGVRVRKSVIR